MVHGGRVGIANANRWKAKKGVAMGEKVYSIGHKRIMFSDTNDEFACLCTFPHNNEEKLGVEDLQSLSIFGAVVQLVLKGYYDDHEGEYIFIPHDVPPYVLRDVRSLTKRAIDGGYALRIRSGTV